MQREVYMGRSAVSSVFAQGTRAAGSGGAQAWRPKWAFRQQSAPVVNRGRLVAIFHFRLRARHDPHNS
jgi:hypothetical protein